MKNYAVINKVPSFLLSRVSAYKQRGSFQSRLTLNPPVIRMLHHWAESVPTKAEGKQKEHQHSKKALQTWGYPNWIFVISAKTNGPNHTGREAKLS